MREIPDGPGLLDIARETLLSDVVPRLAPEHRLPALMAANAMAIAGREARAGTAWEADLAGRLAALPGMEGPDGAALLAQLAAGIRAGDADPGTSLHGPAGAFLHAYAEARCRISAPKALRAP